MGYEMRDGQPMVWGDRGWQRFVGPTREESEAYWARVDADHELEPAIAARAPTPWSVVVWGTGSQNTTVMARTGGEAERLAIAGWEDGSLEFDETAWGHMDAEAEEA